MVSEQNNMPSLELARQNFKIWNDALQTNDPRVMAELYSESATFLPTLNPEFKKGQEQTAAYFEHFMQKNPTGAIMTDECQVLGADCYLHSGLYNFTLGPEDKREVVEARFSYVWQKDKEGNWKIIHHHSSVRPR